MEGGGMLEVVIGFSPYNGCFGMMVFWMVRIALAP
jgi:hypothetical protein